MTQALFDLHTHSTASDGLLSPRELCAKARAEGISAIALTDHDTVAGLMEGRAAAQELGVQFVSGIELDIAWHPGEFHLLGLGLGEVSHEMEEIITLSRRSREERNKKILALMAVDGVEATFGALDNGRPLGRPHIADFLVKRGMVRTRQEAFDKYLGRGKKWYVQREGADLDMAINAILTSGGVPVIAHPMSLYISWGHMAEVLDDLKSRGVQGVEAWHSSAKEADCRRLEHMAHERGLWVSAGSDWHGDKSRRLGHSSGGHCITAAYIDKALLERLGIKMTLGQIFE